MLTSKEVAMVIIQQLGGNMFKMMTAASSFSHGTHNGNPCVTFRIGANPKKIFGVRISLNGMDTYDMEFLTNKKMNVSVASTANHVYNDMLQDCFTAHTGLYTKL